MIRARQLPALAGWARGWALPDRRPLHEWLHEHVRLGGGYSRRGHLDVRTCRHLEEPLAAYQSEHVREITIRAGIQTMKTLFVEACSLWAIANEPGPMMWTHQDDASAKEHVKSRYRGLMRACAPVAALLPRGHDTSTLEIYFGDFFLIVNGANPNNLQSKSIRHKFNTECWLWKSGLLTQARRRVSAYERDGLSKVVNESQGSLADDDFDKLWHEGTREVWAVPCAGCGQRRPLEFFARLDGDAEKRAGVVWDAAARREDGTWDEERVRASARYVCPACGHEHPDTARTRAAWNAGGAYTPPRAGADPRHRSFTWNALTVDSFAKLAAEFTAAAEFKHRGVLQPMKDFYQQRLALPWRAEEQEVLTVQTITLSDYTLAQVAAEPLRKIEAEAARFATLDRQRDHFWLCVRAWRADGSSRLLWWGKVLTVEQAEEIRARHGVEPQLFFEDAQYDTPQVYGDCVRFGWTALHGTGEEAFTHRLTKDRKVQRFYSPIKWSDVNGQRLRYMFWASEPVKDMLMALRQGRSHRWELPADVPDGYKVQLGFPMPGPDGQVRQRGGDVKRERINKQTGRPEWRWTKAGPNHAWDCEAMQVAAALALQVLPSVEAGKDFNTEDAEGAEETGP